MNDSFPQSGRPVGSTAGGSPESTSLATQSEPDDDLVQALRRGNEDAFVALVSRYYSAMLSLALLYVPSHAVAEEVVQETWLAVLQGISRFEGRSSLKTWMFHILVNIAKTRGQREERSIPLSSLAELDLDRDEPAVEPERFLPPDHELWPHGWLHAPQSWAALPEEQLLSRETGMHIQQAIAALPPMQREVIRLRDLEGWSGEEVCNTLELSETNQRVLLHRARSKVRASLEQYFAEK
jgi:RNA polymerase sigma-70 factor, ECF subfamily